jgi:hypothetical protein
MAVDISSLVSQEEQAQLTPTELRTLYDYGDLYRRIRQKDIFGTVSGTLAAIGDIMGGGVTATSLLSKREGPGDTSKRRAELLRTLAEYNQSRREERGRVEEARITQIGELAQNESDLRKFALEKRVEMYNTQVNASAKISAAKIAQYTSALNAADRAIENSDTIRGSADATSRMSEQARKIYNDKIARIETLRADPNQMEGGQIPPSRLAQEIQDGTGGLDDRQMELVIAGLRDQYADQPQVPIAETVGAAAKQLAGQGEFLTGAGSAGFLQRVSAFSRGNIQRQSDLERAQKDRDEIHGTYMRQFGVPRDSELASDMLTLSRAQGADGVSNAMGTLGIQIPTELEAQAQDRGLEEDDTTRAIKAELAKLDDPRYLFPGSPHEQLRRQIEDSPEYAKWRGETYGEGAVDPDVSFKKFLNVTASELNPQQSMRTMEASNAITGAGSMPIAQRNAALKSNLTSGMSSTPGGALALGETEAGEERQPVNLSEMLSRGASAKRAYRMSSPESNQASPLAASQAQLYTQQLKKKLAVKPLPSFEDIDFETEPNS